MAWVRTCRSAARGFLLIALIVGPSAWTDAAERRPPAQSREPAQPRDIAVTAPSPAGSPYAESWAVIIGINDYRHPRIPKLRYAVNDARAVERTLRAQGFHPERIRVLVDADASKARIEGILGDELRGQVGPNDRVLVFFSGHGKTDRLRSGEEEGYLLPVDGDPGRLFSTAISMTALRQISDRIPAKHILYVVDACYSGYALYNRSISDDLYEELIRKPAIQILTAGRHEDQAQERGGQGVFTEVLVRGLAGAAFSGKKPWLALEELGLWVKQRVYAESNRRQVPQYGNLSGEGQFVFVLPGKTAGEQGSGGAGGSGPGTGVPPVASLPSVAPPSSVPRPPSATMQTADLDLASEPSGATVKLDGREVGKSPLTLERLPVGEHTLELTKDGIWVTKRQVTLTPNTLEKLSLRLERLKGKLTVFSEPRDATVLIDGKPVGTAPLSLDLEAGTHALRLTKEGYKPHEESFTLPADTETRTRIALKSTRGTLDIRTTPPEAAVLLQDTSLGQTPLTLQVEEGIYPLRLRLPKHKSTTRQVEIQAERTTRLAIDLAPGSGGGEIERRGKDSAEMVFLPEGTFIMGDSHGDGEEEEKPPHQVTIAEFWLDKTEVTNAQFTRFIQAGHDAQGNWQQYASGKDTHPVVNITWHDAVSYCRWAQKRLPTEAEWEYAARGTDGRKYPWGNAYEESRGRFSGGTAPVGSYPTGASPFGVLDLAGNVWEWTSSLYKPYPYSATDGREGLNVSGQRVGRGGSWSLIPRILRSADRSRNDPANRFYGLGFRCAQDVQ